VVSPELGGIRAEPMYAEMCLDVADHRNTFLGRQKRGEELHNVRVCIQSNKRLAVSKEPLPEY
jgi:hypothetical protein